MATYLDGRIQSDPTQKPGRTPDMSDLCAAEVRLVLRQMNSSPDLAMARKEAGWRLRNNHERVLEDIVNPSTDLNIDGKPLTQASITPVRPSCL